MIFVMVFALQLTKAVICEFIFFAVYLPFHLDLHDLPVFLLRRTGKPKIIQVPLELTCGHPDHVFVVDNPNGINAKFIVACRATIPTKQRNPDAANLFPIHLYLVLRKLSRIGANKVIEGNLCSTLISPLII